jgi:hypothetical protein
MGRFVCAFIVTIFTCALVAPADTAVLTPDKDNTLFQTTAGNLSDGGGQALYAGRTGQSTLALQIRRGLLHFNLSSIPAGAAITSASLRLTAENRGQNGDRAMTLHMLLQDWGQGNSGGGGSGGGLGGPATLNDATWLYRFYVPTSPATSSTWTTAGGAFSSTSSGSATCPNLGGNFTFNGNSTSQMVADIRAWLANPTNNFGWELSGDESTSYTAKRIYSREYPTVSQRPTLTITYSVPEPAALLLLTGLTSLIVFRRRL